MAFTKIIGKFYKKQIEQLYKITIIDYGINLPEIIRRINNEKKDFISLSVGAFA